jgi:hypothetical protein
VNGLWAMPSSTDLAPLATDDALWSQVLERTRAHLELVSRGMIELVQSSLAVVVSAVRQRSSESRLLPLLRRALARTDLGSENHLRCLRALARTGERIDMQRLLDALRLTGRVPRIALIALTEVAATEQGEALEQLVAALDGGMRVDAAFLLSCIGSDDALDALSRHLRTPGPTGIHAAAALLAIEDDPFAFEVLCERLCEPLDAVLAARALWNASPDGSRLSLAESTLARWARRGAVTAESGRQIAAVALAARNTGQDVAATQRALGSENDELVLLAAQAAYALGDAERARGAVQGLFRRGPVIAGAAFQLLASWADMGDLRSQALLRTLLERRPVDLGRVTIFETLATTTRPALRKVVVRALSSPDRLMALEAGRALARLREPPSSVPPLWL